MRRGERESTASGPSGRRARDLGVAAPGESWSERSTPHSAGIGDRDAWDMRVSCTRTTTQACAASGAAGPLLHPQVSRILEALPPIAPRARARTARTRPWGLDW